MSVFGANSITNEACLAKTRIFVQTRNNSLQRADRIRPITCS